MNLIHSHIYIYTNYIKYILFTYVHTLNIKLNGYYNIKINSSSDIFNNNKYRGQSSKNYASAAITLKSWPNLSDAFNHSGHI